MGGHNPASDRITSVKRQRQNTPQIENNTKSSTEPQTFVERHMQREAEYKARKVARERRRGRILEEEMKFMERVFIQVE